MKAQLVADIESLDAVSVRINKLLGQIVDTITKNRDRMSHRDWWVYGLRLVQNARKAEIIRQSKKDILSKIKKVISAPDASG